MKRFILYFSAQLLIILPLSCKYDEGPAISLRGVEQRIIGDYKVTEFSINDIDNMTLYNDSCGCRIGFAHYKQYHQNPVATLEMCKKWAPTYGIYKISKNKKTLLISYHDSQMLGVGPIGSLKSSVWEIKRLTDKDLWIETNYNSDKYFLKLEDIIK